MISATVVHLARRSNDVALLRAFVDSYTRFESGLAHELLVVCKGFDRLDDVQAELKRAARPFRLFQISDEGVDIGAYFASIAAVTTELVCFLNSHSRVRAEGWLAKLMDGLRTPGVGVAGATASYESTSSVLASQLRASWRGLIRSPRQLVSAAVRVGEAAALYPLWPNPHLRTNGFAIRTATLRGLTIASNDRGAALAFESGRRSMTRQLAHRGLSAIVVGADGRTFEPHTWPESETFRSGDQRNLLIGDNQTRRYQVGEAEERRYLGRLAWGDRFRSDATTAGTHA